MNDQKFDFLPQGVTMLPGLSACRFNGDDNTTQTRQVPLPCLPSHGGRGSIERKCDDIRWPIFAKIFFIVGLDLLIRQKDEFNRAKGYV